MVCGTICCSGLGGSSGCAPSTHREALGVAPGLPCFFASQILAQWGWCRTPTSHCSEWGGRIWGRSPTCTPEFDEGPDSILYTGGATTVAKTAGWARQSWSTARSFWRLTDSDMGYTDELFLCLLLFSGLLWHLVVVPAVVAPHGGLCSWHIPGQFRSLVLRMALVYPCSHSGAEGV